MITDSNYIMTVGGASAPLLHPRGSSGGGTHASARTHAHTSFGTLVGTRPSYIKCFHCLLKDSNDRLGCGFLQAKTGQCLLDFAIVFTRVIASREKQHGNSYHL